MRFINDILTQINESVKTAFSDSVCANSDFFGIAHLVTQKARDDKDNKVAPYVYDNGEYKYSGIDNDKSLIIYHRVDTIATTRLKNGGYGDNDSDRQYAPRMSMIVFANRETLGCSSEELALIISAMFPGQLSKQALDTLRFKTTTITVNEIVLNEQRVFNEEYKNVKYCIEPEHIFFKINYTIESTFNAKCFKKCN